MNDAAWSALTRDVAGLPDALRSALAAAWTHAARFEHASIASFSKFSLQLLSVAAPPELIADAHRAALDEIQHATLSFRLASVYAGRPLGPGPLPLEARAFDGLRGREDWPQILASTITEGCIGETLAATQAQAACEAARYDAVREVLAIIAREEAEHASLAYRFVAWSLREAPELRELAQRTFAACVQELQQRTAASQPDAALEPHGRLSSDSQRRVEIEALTTIIIPAAHSLFSTS